MIKWILDLATQRAGLKLLSLLLAIGFWFYVTGEESMEITKPVPLEIVSSNDELRVIKSSTYFLDATFRAPRNLISAISAGAITASHRIVGIDKPGNYSFSVQPSDFNVPTAAIRIVRIYPSVVTVTVDEMVVKKVAVEVDLNGEPAFGYRIDRDQIELDPNAVLVEGPKAILEKIDSVKTEPIELVGRVRSFRRTVRIQPAEGLRVTGDGIAEVQIPIKAEFSEREFKEIVIKPMGVVGPEHYVDLDPEQISLVLKGPKAILDQAKPEDFIVYADVDGFKEGTYEVPARLILPPDLLLKGDPPQISVAIKKLKF